MAEWNAGSQPHCNTHGFVYHSCCKECRHEHGMPVQAPKGNVMSTEEEIRQQATRDCGAEASAATTFCATEDQIRQLAYSLSQWHTQSKIFGQMHEHYSQLIGGRRLETPEECWLEAERQLKAGS